MGVQIETRMAETDHHAWWCYGEFYLGNLHLYYDVQCLGRRLCGRDDVKEGFYVSDLFKDFGFQDGDKIIKINGEVPFDVLDVNRNLFLRDIGNIEVNHPDGNSEMIDLPEDIGLQMWTTGNMDPFNPQNSRHTRQYSTWYSRL